MNAACNRFFESRNMPNGKQAFMMENNAEIKRSFQRKNRAQKLAETAAEEMEK